MRKFEELRGYLLNDVIGTKTGILTIAFPKLVLSTGQWPPVKQRAFLMAVNEEGNISTKASMSVDNSGFVYGPNTHVAKDGDRILVAVNRGRLGQLSSYERDVFGFPLYCFQNGSSTLLSVDESGLVSELPAGRFENFHIQSVVSWAGGWYIGGELLDHCLDRGVAAVYRVMGENSKNLVWTDETPFRSYLRGMVVADGKLVVAVNEERAIRISKADMNLSQGYNKHWWENVGSFSGFAHEASIVSLKENGMVVSRHEVSSGAGVFLDGISWAQGVPLIFGALGGQPALNLGLNQ